MKTIFIVGASAGIGLELTKIYLQNNFNVIASSRNATNNVELLTLQDKYKNSLLLKNLDVSQAIDPEQIKSIYTHFNSIDIWFYNAGAYEVMKIDEWDYEHFKTMNDTNYLGVVQLMTLLIPYFRQNGGKWIWNLSLSSYFGLPFGGGYSAPKAALCNLAESIYPELKKENINLQIINHGFVKTRLTNKNEFEMPQLMSPEFCAKEIFKRTNTSNSFEIHFPFRLSLFLNLLKYLPYKISLYLTGKIK